MTSSIFIVRPVLRQWIGGLLCLLFICPSILADTVVFRDGRQLKGTVLNVGVLEVEIKREDTGNVEKIPRSELARIVYDSGEVHEWETAQAGQLSDVGTPGGDPPALRIEPHQWRLIEEAGKNMDQFQDRMLAGLVAQTVGTFLAISTDDVGFAILGGTISFIGLITSLIGLDSIDKSAEDLKKAGEKGDSGNP